MYIEARFSSLPIEPITHPDSSSVSIPFCAILYLYSRVAEPTRMMYLYILLRCCLFSRPVSELEGLSYNNISTRESPRILLLKTLDFLHDGTVFKSITNREAYNLTRYRKRRATIFFFASCKNIRTRKQTRLKSPGKNQSSSSLGSLASDGILTCKFKGTRQLAINC